MDKITPEMVMSSLVVAAALIGFALLCWQLVDKIRAARKPQAELQARIERLENLEKGQQVMLRAINSIISHEINGNSSEKLKMSQQEILDYLIEK